jgi:fumarate hydratase class I
MRTRHLQLPLDDSVIRELRAGDPVLLSGRIVTGRDRAHRWLAEQRREALRPYLEEGAVYHCGPIMYRDKETWHCRAAGPTTSLREEPYMADILDAYRLRCIIGKGGMGERTATALSQCAAVYLHAVGGAAVHYTEKVTKVEDVFMLKEFGMPEALWVLQVKALPLIVSMDTVGNSLHRDILKASQDRLPGIVEKLDRAY